MAIVKRKFKLNGVEYEFSVATIVDRNIQEPVTSAAVFAALDDLFPLKGYTVADNITTDTSEGLARTNSLVTVSSLVDFLRKKGVIS